VSATLAIQTAIYGVLSADATIPTLSRTIDTRTNAVTLVGVYNDVPDGATYPQVLITRATETPWHTMGGASAGLGWKDIIRIHVFSRYQGDLEALEIHNRIVTLLNFQPLTVSGFSSATVEYENGRMLVEAIDKIETRHWVAEYCVRVQQ
jgi:hypothetical protein